MSYPSLQLEHAAFDEAVSIEDVNPSKAASLYHSVLAEEDPANALVKVKEESIARLGALYAKQGQGAELKRLFVDIRPFFTRIPKSRTAKIVRALIDGVIASAELGAGHAAALQAAAQAAPHKQVKEAGAGVKSVQVEIVEEAIAWCQQEKRTFLKQRLQSRLAALLVKLKQYTDALPLIAKLIREVKKFDDKLLLVEVFLVESRAHLALQNSQDSAHQDSGIASIRFGAPACLFVPLRHVLNR